MQQQEQGEERCETQENSCPESQENSHPESQDNASDEIAPDATSSHEEENDCKESELEAPSATTPDEVDGENGINDSASSDPPSTRSKTSRSAKKRHNKIDKGDIETVENATSSEGKHDNGFSEPNITAEEESTPINEVTRDEEDDLQDIIVEEQDETIVLQTSGESSLAEYTVEFPLEDRSKEESQNIVIEEEEISISASVSCEEIDESEGKCSEASEKYTLTISSSELHQFTPIFDGQENASISENLSQSMSSLGGGIRSISARKPVRKSSHFVPHGRSSVSTERGGTDGNYSDTDCSVDTTEGSTFSSQKRKACSVETNSKKQKLNDSKNSKFFSMVSSPLRMLKNKLSDRIVESLSAPCTDDLANGNNENEEDDDITTDKINVEENEIKEKSLCVVSNEVTNQNSMYRSWCSIM